MENSYELVVSYISPEDEYVGAHVNVVHRQIALLTLFSVNVSLERQNGLSLSDYEVLAKKKAASFIQEVAAELMIVA